MGAQRVGKALARIVDAHLHHRRVGVRQFAAVLDLAQRRDHARPDSWSARPSRRRPRYSRCRDSAKRMTIDSSQATAISANGDHDRDAARRPCRRRCRCAAREAAPPWKSRRKTISPKNEIDAGDDDRDHHHAHVAIADMGELVAEHGFELRVVERVDQPARHRDRILLLVEAGGEGIERVVVGDAAASAW